MGALRFKDDVDAILEKDPYDLFTAISAEKGHRAARRLSPRALGFAGAAAAGVAVAAGILALTLWRRGGARDADASPYAYFEVKAIDPDGRPVAGAIVKEGARQVGVTDSFGEWRRFMRVRPGATVMLEISKQLGGATLAAVKSLAVPPALPKDGDIELTGSVRLARGAVDDQATRQAAAETGAASDGYVLGSGGREVQSQNQDAAGREAPRRGDVRGASAAGARERNGGGRAADLDGAANRATVARSVAASPDALSNGPDIPPVAAPLADAKEALRARGIEEIADRDIPSSGAPAARVADEAAGLAFDALWIGADGRPYAPLSEVMGLVKKRAATLGVRLDADAPVRLVLKDLAAPAEGAESHLIHVEALHGGKTLFTFLRNYQDDALATARDVLWAATMHAPVSHNIQKNGDDWLVEPSRASLWALAPGRFLESGGGHLIPVVEGEAKTLRLMVGAAGPCSGAEHCALVTPGVGRVSPIAGWQRLRLQILGPVGDGARVFVSGFAALPEGRAGQFGYWGHPGANANVTVVRDGRVVLRSRILASARGATISVPQNPTARR